MLLGKNAIIQV